MNTGTIKLNIDGRDIEAENGGSILGIALGAGIYIPHLCHHPDLPPIGACRLCTVEIAGWANPAASCITLAASGMVINTRTEKVTRFRRLAMELLLAAHPRACDTCSKYLNCELQALKQYLIQDDLTVRTRDRIFPVNTKNPLFLHDPNKCVACGRCVRACLDLRGVGILEYVKQGDETYCGTGANLPLSEAGCRFCGACAEVCPTGAISDKAELVKEKNRKLALVPCRYTCPAEIDVPRYILYIRKKNYRAAGDVIREKVPFPEILGHICDHPCEAVCRRGYVNQPVAIRELKRFATGLLHSQGAGFNRGRKPATDKKVAVIGSGPAGLTAAYYLWKQGHEVTVFEMLAQAGGMMRVGIPEYHLPREVLDREIANITGLGIKIKTEVRIEAIDRLFAAGYGAVVVAVGTHAGQKLPLPGVQGTGVLTSIEFLRGVHLEAKTRPGDNVVVIGGGSVAFDCARVARRLGAKAVHVVCLESRKEIPASRDELDEGEAEGVLVHPSLSVSAILRENGRIVGVELAEVSFFGFDEDNNIHVEVHAEAKHHIEADCVIFAIGQKPEIPAGFGIDLNTKKLIDLDTYSLNTSREGIFAAGDAVTGTASVIQAIASGRKTAIAVDRFLGGSGNIEERLVPAEEPEKCLGKVEGFAGLPRATADLVQVSERTSCFCPVLPGLDEEEAERESGRCLHCDLRLKMTPVKFWSSY